VKRTLLQGESKRELGELVQGEEGGGEQLRLMLVKPMVVKPMQATLIQAMC